MSMLEITLEFTRARDGADPNAFRFDEARYYVRGRRGRQEEVRFDWKGPVVDQLEALKVHPTHRGLREMGDALRGFLLPIGWLAYEEEIIDAVRADRPIRINIWSNAAELYALPWELLRLRSNGQPLAELPNCAIAYTWPGIEPATIRRRAGRLLVAWSEAGGRVPHKAHIADIQRAVGTRLRFEPDKDVVPHASVGALERRLREGGTKIGAVHLLCHGSDDALLMNTYTPHWLTDDPAPDRVDAARLRRLLARYANHVSLVTLCACSTGDNLSNLTGSAAQAVHRAGFPAVIASRFPLSTSGSITMASAFYGELERNTGDVERAAFEARRALSLEGCNADHVGMQVYVHRGPGEVLRFGPDGHAPSQVVEAEPVPSVVPEPHVVSSNPFFRRDPAHAGQKTPRFGRATLDIGDPGPAAEGAGEMPPPQPQKRRRRRKPRPASFFVTKDTE